MSKTLVGREGEQEGRPFKLMDMAYASDSNENTLCVQKMACVTGAKHMYESGSVVQNQITEVPEC